MQIHYMQCIRYYYVDTIHYTLSTIHLAQVCEPTCFMFSHCTNPVTPGIALDFPLTQVALYHKQTIQRSVQLILDIQNVVQGVKLFKGQYNVLQWNDLQCSELDFSECVAC